MTKSERQQIVRQLIATESDIYIHINRTTTHPYKGGEFTGNWDVVIHDVTIPAHSLELSVRDWLEIKALYNKNPEAQELQVEYTDYKEYER